MLSTDTSSSGTVTLTALKVATTDEPLPVYTQWLADAGGAGAGTALPTMTNTSTVQAFQHQFAPFSEYDATMTATDFSVHGGAGIGIFADPLTNAAPTSTPSETLDSSMIQTVDRPTFIYTFPLQGADMAITNGIGYIFPTETLLHGRFNQIGDTDRYIEYAVRFTMGSIEIYIHIAGTGSANNRITAYGANNAVQGRLSLGVEPSGSKYLVTLRIPNYELSGNIIPPISEYKTRIAAYTGDWKMVYLDNDAPNSNYRVLNNGDQNLFVMASQMPGTGWQASKVVALDNVIHPSDTLTTPFYFKCTTAGATGSSEPVWNTTAGSTTSDGSAVWTLVERLKQPIVIGPTTPSLIS